MAALFALDPHDPDPHQAPELAALAVRLAHPIPRPVPGMVYGIDGTPVEVRAAWPAAILVEDLRTHDLFTLTRAEWIALAEPGDDPEFYRDPQSYRNQARP